VDPRVGLTDVVAPGQQVARGQSLARVHAASEADAEAACAQVQAALMLGEAGAQAAPDRLVLEVVSAPARDATGPLAFTPESAP
jgi:thymidine phosphorylase